MNVLNSMTRQDVTTYTHTDADDTVFGHPQVVILADDPSMLLALRMALGQRQRTACEVR
jgi:hypothetical protein